MDLLGRILKDNPVNLLHEANDDAEASVDQSGDPEKRFILGQNSDGTVFYIEQEGEPGTEGPEGGSSYAVFDSEGNQLYF